MTYQKNLQKPAEGWKLLANDKKWHYFRNGISLCGKWSNLGTGDSNLRSKMTKAKKWTQGV